MFRAGRLLQPALDSTADTAARLAPSPSIFSVIDRKQHEDMLKHVTGSPLQPGACEAGDVLNGYGIKQFEDGAIYAGDFVNGQRSGSGVQRWLDGHVYVGDWCQDVRCGRGLYRFSHGDKDGSGYIEDNECDRYEGEWQSGKFHGQGMCSFASFCFGGEPSRVDMIHASAAAACRNPSRPLG